MNSSLAEMKQTILNYLLRVPEIDDAINDILSMVGERFHVDRAYIFETSEDGLCCCNTYEWCSEGTPPEIDNLRRVRYLEDLGGCWQENYDENGLFLCRDIGTLPEIQRKMLAKQHITGMLQYAISVHGEFKGFIGFDNCSAARNWEDDQDAIDTLCYTAHILSLYLMDSRHHAAKLATRENSMNLQLQKSNERYEELLENISCGVIIFRVTEGGLVLDYANRGFCKLMGKTEEEVFEAYKHDVTFIVDQAQREEIRAVLRRAVIDMYPQSVQFSAGAYAGRPLWLTAKIKTIRKEDGTKSVFVTYFDVTGETAATNELRKKYELEKQRRHDDKSALAYAVFNLSANQTVDMVRRSPLTPLPAFLSMEAFKADIAASIEAEDEKRRFLATFNTADLLEKYRSGVEEQTLDFQRTLPDGRTIWVRSHFRTIAEPGGSDMLLIYTCNDINVPKSHALLTTQVISNDYDMAGYVNFKDDSAVLLYGRNARQMAFAHHHTSSVGCFSEMVEWFAENLVVPEERAGYQKADFIKNLRDELARSGAYQITLHALDERGERCTKRIQYLRYEQNANIAFFTQTDVTEVLAQEEKRQRQLQKALDASVEAANAKTEFLSRMSHEIRTPMNGIIGMTKLAEDAADNPETKDYLRQIDESSQYMLGLLNDVLDMNSIQSGRLALKYEWVNARQLLWSCIEMMVPMMEQKGLHFVHQNINQPSNTEIYCDRLRVQQIVMNLLNNAYKFTPRGGTVTLAIERTERDDGCAYAKITVKDTGIGMSEDFLKNKAFEPFAQEGNDSYTSVRGTGLGLPLVKAIVEMMHGDITVESAVGKGTEFIIALDVQYRHHLSETAERQDAVSFEGLAGKRVLVVDDHPLNRKIATALLERCGMRVEQAENGRLALDAVSAAPEQYFDAILMDIRMPVMDGIESAKRIRRLSRADAQRVPIIAMTANAFADDIQASMAAGMNAHLAKPVNTEKLYEVLAELTGR